MIRQLFKLPAKTARHRGLPEHGASGLLDPVFHMASPTHHANLMIRKMVAVKLQQFLPQIRTSNIQLQYWGISDPSVDIRENERIFQLGSEQHVPFRDLKDMYERGDATRFEWFGYGQRLENFPPKQVCQELFKAPDLIGERIEDNCILCPIRGSEILDAIHPGYTVVPINFYEEIFRKTKLKPVFMGQLDDNSFVSTLKSRFPSARYLPHKDVLTDFQTIRKARHIILPVSTFAWLAAWLSNAEQIILPIFGIYDPKVFALHDLLPVHDKNYKFYQFPIQSAVPLDELDEAHSKIDGAWYEIDRRALIGESARIEAGPA